MKKWKKYTLIFSAIFLLFAGSLFYLATREDPRYVAAAKNIDALRKEARETFGAKSWEEHREENGIEFQDDRDAWKAITDSAPQELKDFIYNIEPPLEQQAEIYQRHQIWFDELHDKIEPLRVHHVYIEEWNDWHMGLLAELKAVSRHLALAIEATAQLGDLKSLEQALNSSLIIRDKCLEEPDPLTSLVGISLHSIYLRSIGRAAVQNRHDSSVMQIIADSIKNIDPMPAPTDMFASAYRSDRIYLELIGSFEQWQVDVWLESSGYFDEEEEKRPTISDKFSKYWDSYFADEDIVIRKMGNNTIDALEARWIETLLAANETALQFPKQATQIIKDSDELMDKIYEQEDISWEFASVVIFIHIDSVTRDLMREKSVLAAFELINRYPEISDIPDEMPADIMFEDLYSPGNNVTYRKTAKGFEIYWIGIDGVDNGFVNESFEEFPFGVLRRDEDWGVIVNYDPAISRP